MTGIGIPSSQSRIGISISMFISRIVIRAAASLLNGPKVVLDPQQTCKISLGLLVNSQAERPTLLGGAAIGFTLTWGKASGSHIWSRPLDIT